MYRSSAPGKKVSEKIPEAKGVRSCVNNRNREHRGTKAKGKLAVRKLYRTTTTSA